ncbi:hypothetical protein BH09PAT4_BH09PAT4_09700 [soil metagenome]
MSHNRRLLLSLLVAPGLGGAIDSATIRVNAGVSKTPNACDTLALGTLTGEVRRLDGAPLGKADVSIFWNDLSIAPGTAQPVSRTLRLIAPVTASGGYRACNIPLSTTLLISVLADDSARSGIVQGEIAGSRVLFLDLLIGDGSVRTVSGLVLASDEQPIVGARVKILDGQASAVSSARGEFRLLSVPTGTQATEITAVGYEPRHEQLDVTLSGATLSVTMDRKVVQLDSVKTVAVANRADDPRYRSFEQRVQNGIGYFVTAKQIADMRAISTDEILRRVPSVRVLTKHSPSVTH